jgi:hypothetical protein
MITLIFVTPTVSQLGGPLPIHREGSIWSQLQMDSLVLQTMHVV